MLSAATDPWCSALRIFASELVPSLQHQTQGDHAAVVLITTSAADCNMHLADDRHSELCDAMPSASLM